MDRVETLAASAIALWASGALRWDEGGVTFTVTREPRLRGRMLCVVVEAEKDGESLPLDGANPFLFVNPPLKVDDREDHEAALRAIIRDAVLDAARRRGWVG